MLGLLLSLSLLALSATPVEPPSGPAAAFDEKLAIAHYEAFFFRYFTAEWGADEAKKHFVKTAKKADLPAVDMPSWPVDTRYGLYANAMKKLQRFTWVGAGSSAWLKDRPEAERDTALGALGDMSTIFFDGFNDHIAPVYCAPAGAVSFAYKGAAACYFMAMNEYYERGFWVALRELDGRVVIAGVLEHKRQLDEPEKDPKLKPFLAAIEKQLAPKQEPKAPKRTP